MWGDEHIVAFHPHTLSERKALGTQPQCGHQLRTYNADSTLITHGPILSINLVTSFLTFFFSSSPGFSPLQLIAVPL